jgi:hypothetical protein
MTVELAESQNTQSNLLQGDGAAECAAVGGTKVLLSPGAQEGIVSAQIAAAQEESIVLPPRESLLKHTAVQGLENADITLLEEALNDINTFKPIRAPFQSNIVEITSEAVTKDMARQEPDRLKDRSSTLQESDDDLISKLTHLDKDDNKYSQQRAELPAILRKHHSLDAILQQSNNEASESEPNNGPIPDTIISQQQRIFY